MIVGRRDQMFVSGGENIYPEEIERCIAAVPGINFAADFEEEGLKVPIVGADLSLTDADSGAFELESVDGIIVDEPS